MHPFGRKFTLLAALTLVAVTVVHAAPVGRRAIVLAERVTGGQLDLPWLNGLFISNNLKPLTLDPSHPAYNNPSGDHTVGEAMTSSAPDSGGVIVTCTDPGGISDYSWEGWVFTGDGNSRRGLIVRADPSNGFATNYQFVMQQGMAQFAFRRLAGQGPATTLRTWFAGDFPGGVPQVNTWHHMAILAQGSSFRCFWDGFEVTTIGGLGPIVDGTLTSGWVGVYNFRFDVGNIPFYVDDLLLDTEGPTPVEAVSWGQVRSRWK